MISRRRFGKYAMGGGVLAGLGDFGFLSRLPRVSAEEARLDIRRVTFDSGLEPLVRLLEDTDREKVLEEVAMRIRGGTPYCHLLAALLLAGVRNIQPRPVGFKFHAVLVVHSAHLASLDAGDEDRWLPLFWAIDQFKSSQAQDVKEGDWTMAPVDEAAVPPAHRARQALVEAMDHWDEAAADAAIAGLVRSAGAHEIFELLCRYAVRDFREIGHKAIYLSNSFRTLEVIGWQHAEPVLRSLVYGMLDRFGEKGNPADEDLPPDRPFRENLPLAAEIKAGWTGGREDSAATTELLGSLRQASAGEVSRLTADLLNRGASPRSVFDALFDGAGELLMQAPGIISLHATTFTNAVHYAWTRCRDDETRKLLLLQNAAFLPLFRGDRKDSGLHVDELEPLSVGQGAAGVEDIFREVSADRLVAARKMLGWLKENPDPRPVAAAARQLVFLKGTNSHDYKFSSAVLEDYHHIGKPWRDRFLAASVYNLRGAGEKDTPLVARIREALG